MRFRRKYRTPAVINHEVIVQNLVDIACRLVMLIVVASAVEVLGGERGLIVAEQHSSWSGCGVPLCSWLPALDPC